MVMKLVDIISLKFFCYYFNVIVNLHKLKEKICVCYLYQGCLKNTFVNLMHRGHLFRIEKKLFLIVVVFVCLLTNTQQQTFQKHIEVPAVKEKKTKKK